MTTIRIAILGTGFWARFQIAAWRELEGVQIVALYNRTKSKAEALAREFHIPNVYDNAETLLQKEKIDAVDIISDPDTHMAFTLLAAKYGVHVICQKPMAPTLEHANAMLHACQSAGVKLLIHENFRWQHPFRQLKAVLESGKIGTVFRGRLQFSTSFPVFENQPFLRQLEQFILTDVGSHALDLARFLLGDASRVYCRTASINPGIQGEDVATVMLAHGKATCTVELSYASPMQFERFPETYAVLEGDLGSVELGADYWLHTTTRSGTFSQRCAPPRHAWADPAYGSVHPSIVPCNQNLLEDLRGGNPAETRAEDNIRTMQLVFASYQSAQSGEVVQVLP